MTKEEILQKCTAKKYDMSPNSSNSFTEDLLKAMDEYAKEIAVGFYFFMEKWQEMGD